MRIPFTTVEAVWHRVGEPVDGVDATRRDLAHPLLPVKVRSIEDGAVARRVQAQFRARAERCGDHIQKGQWSGPRVKQTPTTRVSPQVAQASAEAMRLVRLALYDRRFGACKSDNKKRVGASPPLFPDEDHAELDYPGTAPIHSAARSLSIWNARTHNCDGLTAAALDVLAHRHPRLPTSSVALGDRHILAVIGTLTPAIASRPMAAWPPHLQVCDPWARLSCRACDYPMQFREKMARWAIEGKQLRDAEDRWHSPVDPTWLAIVDQVPEVFKRRPHLNGQFRDVPMRAASPSRDRDTLR
ncbi:hypothetical protein CDL60_18245 [Roseateles noduli]|nr:hypothetical protein CDL60_18245 [Roseateles noduli]